MKYNPKMCDTVAAMPGLAGVHPAAPASLTQGWLSLLVELEETLCEITGMAAATLQPAAGAAGELTGLLLMRAWHDAQRLDPPQGDHSRLRPRDQPGIGDLGRLHGSHRTQRRTGAVWTWPALRSELDEDVAGIMLTNPNTLGLFEEDIAEIAAAVHEVGGLLYYDGANLNAILGVVRPGDMGFDIVHMNLHKTFATPHGGGGPGAGPVAVSERLVPFLPGPRPTRMGESGEDLRSDGWSPNAPSDACTPGTATPWCWPEPWPTSWSTAAMVSGRSPRSPSSTPTGSDSGLSGTYDVPFDRPCMHETVLSARNLKQRHGVRALDLAKRLLEEASTHRPSTFR